MIWKSFILVITCGLYFVSCQAPGTLFLKLSLDELRNTNDIESIQINYSIKTIKDEELVRSNSLMQKSTGNEFSVEIVLNTHDINQNFQFSSTIDINYSINRESITFKDQRFYFNINSTRTINNILYSTTIFYSKNYNFDLDVVLTVKCKPNYYPNYICTKLCIELEKHEKCDSRGNKICDKGYTYDPESDKCVMDWCKLSSEKCNNNAPCQNMKDGIKCLCPTHYTGKFCEKFVDPCMKYKCQNGSNCMVENDKIICVPIRKSAGFQVPNSTTLILIGLCLMLVTIVIVVCVIMCTQNQMRKRSILRQVAQQNPYNHFIPDNQSIEHYKNHFLINQIPSENNSLKTWSHSGDTLTNCSCNNPQRSDTINLLQNRFNDQLSPDRQLKYQYHLNTSPKLHNTMLMRSQSDQNMFPSSNDNLLNGFSKTVDRNVNNNHYDGYSSLTKHNSHNFNTVIRKNRPNTMVTFNDNPTTSIFTNDTQGHPLVVSNSAHVSQDLPAPPPPMSILTNKKNSNNTTYL